MRSEAERPRRNGKRMSIHFAITPQMSEAIDMLLDTGFYGFSRTDVARRMLASALYAELVKGVAKP